ncbi:hypothetical protein QWL27_27665 [Streptomyces thermocarboxydus]|uniref:hypothetical protein n=1 Tax=Streptomyces thermocarboxydus TaxID=59299 RepID=UPI0019A16663|nr:hypothetical protein [Streptomyces thermocarboxydus]GHE64050.1 hypothetical protein GCM10018771_52220 [Streptomyces cellulosae]
MTVLFDMARKVGDLLYEFAEAAVYLNGEVWDLYLEAVREAIPKIEVNLKDGVGMDDVKGLVKGLGKSIAKGASQLGQGIVLNMDTAKLNAIVTEYNRRVDALVPKLDALWVPWTRHTGAPRNSRPRRRVRRPSAREPSTISRTGTPGPIRRTPRRASTASTWRAANGWRTGTPWTSTWGRPRNNSPSASATKETLPPEAGCTDDRASAALRPSPI